MLVVSGLWRNELLDRAKKLRFIQSIGAGTDQFPARELARRGIRLASAQGVNCARGRRARDGADPRAERAACPRRATTRQDGSGAA